MSRPGRAPWTWEAERGPSAVGPVVNNCQLRIGQIKKTTDQWAKPSNKCGVLENGGHCSAWYGTDRMGRGKPPGPASGPPGTVGKDTAAALDPSLDDSSLLQWFNGRDTQRCGSPAGGPRRSDSLMPRSATMVRATPGVSRIWYEPRETGDGTLQDRKCRRMVRIVGRFPRLPGARWRHRPARSDAQRARRW